MTTQGVTHKLLSTLLSRRVSAGLRLPSLAELLRVSAGLGRAPVAAHAGICSKTLERIERGLCWGQPETLQRIAEALGVDPDVYVVAALQAWRQAHARKKDA
jgi:transcriptional regulator with XRE-family HTH domain